MWRDALRYTSHPSWIFMKMKLPSAYIFLTVINEYFGTFSDYNGKETNISAENPVINRKNKIFANGAVIYR